MSKVPDASKRSHVAWTFSRKNFSRVGMLASMIGHTKRDIKGKTSTGCLLAHKLTRFFPVRDTCPWLGGYVVWDSENGRWIRAGKACPGTMGERKVTHNDNANRSDKGVYGDYVPMSKRKDGAGKISYSSVVWVF